LDDGQAEAVIILDSPPGEAKWQDVAGLFQAKFPKMQETATEQAVAISKENARKTAEQRRKNTTILREDAESYRTDRLAEIDREEKEAKLAEEDKGQTLLLEVRDVTGFQKRRASVDTFHQRRIKEINAFENVPEPEPPQPLGVVFVLPPTKG
jgi:microsomal dipeptidase-like Zn-dependent dipeptidase